MGNGDQNLAKLMKKTVKSAARWPGRRLGGYSLVAVTIMTAIILSLTISMVNYMLSSKKTSKAIEMNYAAIEIANAGVDKAIFCLNETSGTNCGGTFGSNYIGETDVAIGNGSFTTALAGTGVERTLTSTGTTSTDVSVTIIVKTTSVPPTDDAAFSYALQSGEGGVHMENNSEITGTIYTDGDVECQSTVAIINGDAYVTKAGGMVDSCYVTYHAHADKVLNSEVDGDAYYNVDPTDIQGTSVGGTKYPGSTRPSPEDMPAIDLDFWRNSAEAGGVISGDYEPADEAILGPVKINGDLILNNNVDITLMGPVWVVGDIEMYNNSTVSLDPSFGTYSTVILADNPADTANEGVIAMVANVDIAGSGDPKSHIALVSTNVSTSEATPSIDIYNNASGAIFYALEGTLRLHNNAGAKALAGYWLYLDNNATVSYLESQLSDLSFSNSPGGIWDTMSGSWRISK